MPRRNNQNKNQEEETLTQENEVQGQVTDNGQVVFEDPDNPGQYIEMSPDQVKDFFKKAQTSEDAKKRTQAKNKAKDELFRRHSDEGNKLYRAACEKLNVSPQATRSRSTLDLSDVDL